MNRRKTCHPRCDERKRPDGALSCRARYHLHLRFRDPLRGRGIPRMKLISSTDGYSGATMQLDFTAFPYAPFRDQPTGPQLVRLWPADCGVGPSATPSCRSRAPPTMPWCGSSIGTWGADAVRHIGSAGIAEVAQRVEFTLRREAHPSEPAIFRARGTGVPLPCSPDCRSWQRLPEGSDPSGR